MKQSKTPITSAEYNQLATKLESMAAAIQARPKTNEYFTARLANLAAEVRKEVFECEPRIKGTRPTVQPTSAG